MAMNTRCSTWHTPIARPTWRRDDFCEGVMPIEPFVLIVADHDRRVFSVEGPMVDDNPWSKPVVDAQDGGKRHINCFVPGGPSRTDVETAAREYQREYGYARVEAGSIVSRQQIGRASCRARVGQSVSIWVVAEYLKQKNKVTPT